MCQANVSRGKAIKALKNNQNDIVNAIMVSFEYMFMYSCFTLNIFIYYMMIVSRVSLIHFYYQNKNYVEYILAD